MSVKINALLLGQTARAYKVDWDNTEMWLPKSQAAIHLNTNAEAACNGRAYDFTLSDWIAKEKGITMAEERYIVVPSEVGRLWLIKDTKLENGLIATSTVESHAEMIAAALNLTEGKL